MKLKAAFFEDISETTEHTGRAGVPEALQRGRPGSERSADQPESPSCCPCHKEVPADRIRYG